MQNLFRTSGVIAATLCAALLLAACGDINLDLGDRPAQQPAPAPSETNPRLPIEAPPPLPPAVELPPPADLPAPPPPREPGLITAGLLLPLSGEFAPLGRDLLHAAQMALFDIAGETFELRVYDTAGLPQVARDAALRAQADGVQLILGPVLASSVRTVRDAVRSAALPVIAFTNDRTMAGGGVYVIGFSPEDQIARVVAFSIRRGVNNFAVLAPSDAYGNRMAGALTDAAAINGAVVTNTAFYTGDTEALTETIKRLARYEGRRAALQEQRDSLSGRSDAISRRALARLEGRDTIGEVGFESLLLPAGGEEILHLAPLLAYYDIDPARTKLFGTWLWDDPALRTEPALTGAWYAAPPPDARRNFVERYQRLYDRRPDRRATLAYDATALAIVLAQRAERAAKEAAAGEDTPPPRISPYTLDALTSPNGFAGMDGIFRLLPSGVVQRGLAVLEIQRDGPLIVDPAPTTFVTN